MQPSPSKNFIDRKLAGDHADRLKDLGSSGFPFFCFLEAAARELGAQEQLHYHRSPKNNAAPRPAYRLITALTLGLDSFQQFDTCKILVDEELTPSQVKQRRDEQAQRLLQLLAPYAEEMGHQAPRDLEDHVQAFLAVWQPSAKEHDHLYEFLVTPGVLNDTAYEVTRTTLELACRSKTIPNRKELTKGLAFAVKYFHQGFTATNLPAVANNLVQNLGIMATYLVNEDTPAKIRRGLRVFQVLWAHGHVPAGLHLAQTCLQYLNAREYHVYGAQVVEDVWKAWQKKPQEFTERKSVEMLYLLRARAMAELVIHSDDDEEVGRATKTLIDLYDGAAARRFAGWHEELTDLLMGHCKDLTRVDPESVHALRGRIQQFPSARAVWEERRNRFLEQRPIGSLVFPGYVPGWQVHSDRGASHE